MKNKYLITKYVFDRVAAFFAILLLLPVFVFTTLLVASDGKGNIIFRQTRVGYGGRFFRIYKFRTMKSTDISFSVNRAVIEEDNDNVTLFGRFLRRFKLDELPQLFNVLKGDMSFVGPRPLLPAYIRVYETWEYCKFKVRPGLTGLAQISGNGHLSVNERSYYDVYYTEKCSLKLDFEILLDTAKAILKGEINRKVRVNDNYIDYFRGKYGGSDECARYCETAFHQSASS
ncbi:MAG: sugar transferase [Clostridia bacterium]|nr:sugar transferase [Clostridia bacterium]